MVPSEGFEMLVSAILRDTTMETTDGPKEMDGIVGCSKSALVRRSPQVDLQFTFFSGYEQKGKRAGLRRACMERETQREFGQKCSRSSTPVGIACLAFFCSQDLTVKPGAGQGSPLRVAQEVP